MGLSEDLERVTLQERELQFVRLDTRAAWELGSKLRTIAEDRGLGVVIDVRRFGQPLFYTALEGTNPDHAEWVRRKSNVVARLHRSSYGVLLSLMVLAVDSARFREMLSSSMARLFSSCPCQEPRAR